jgi:hypothetical protein
MRLGKRQELFARLLPRLLDKAHELGYEVRIGHVMRCQNCYVGRKNSNHKLKLAVDLNLFKNGDFLTTQDAHQKLGEWWEQQHELCAWGGRFNDANHYSIVYQGRK